MSTKPELIIVSQNLLGGGASFHRNMLSNFPVDYFDIKCIYLNPTNWHGAKALEVKLNANDTIFSYGGEPENIIAKRLSALIPNSEGAIVTNLETELVSLDLYRKPLKTVYFICHDDGFLPLAIKYESIIDVFIAHNIAVYNELIRLFSKRKNSIFFIQHGVTVPDFTREPNNHAKLNIVFLARHHAFKGIYDLPVINELLVQKNIAVEWTILGDGPERNNLIKQVEHLPNFRFEIPQSTADVLAVLKNQDVFILPSRSDGLPVALLESMSVGCVPVLANFSEGIKKVVTDEIGFVLPVGDNDGFAHKIALLSNDRSMLQRLSANCTAKVKVEFNIEKQALEYYNLYTDFRKYRSVHRVGVKGFHRRAIHNRYYRKLFDILSAVRTKLVPRP